MDSRKARSNLAKHGIAFEEAGTVFGDPRSRTIPDPEHSQTEHRFVTMGKALDDKLLVVVHTDRGDNRIISARQANPRERRFYEEESS